MTVFDRTTEEALESAAPAQEVAPVQTPRGWMLRPFSDLGAYVEPDWIWHGWLAPGHVTLMPGQHKKGKSTLLAGLVREFDRKEPSSFAGIPTRPCRMLIVTEEPFNEWARRRDEMAITGDQIYLANASKCSDEEEWLAFLGYVLGVAFSTRCELVIFDALNKFWPVADENSAAETTRCIEKLVGLAECPEWPVAVLALHHTGKTRHGDSGLQARGSSALPSMVYAQLLFEEEPQYRDTNIRTLTYDGRWKCLYKMRRVRFHEDSQTFTRWIEDQAPPTVGAGGAPGGDQVAAAPAGDQVHEHDERPRARGRSLGQLVSFMRSQDPEGYGMTVSDISQSMDRPKRTVRSLLNNNSGTWFERVPGGFPIVYRLRKGYGATDQVVPVDGEAEVGGGGEGAGAGAGGAEGEGDSGPQDAA